MTKTLKVALAGAGAFGLRHLDAIKLIDGVETISLIGRELDKTKEAAAKYGVGHVTTDLADTLKLPGLDAVILATPTQMHAAQALQCLKAGKHVQIEIPLADSLKDAEAVVAAQKRAGSSPWSATPAASTRAISSCASAFSRTSSISSRWTCRPFSSAAPT